MNKKRPLIRSILLYSQGGKWVRMDFSRDRVQFQEESRIVWRMDRTIPFQVTLGFCHRSEILTWEWEDDGPFQALSGLEVGKQHFSSLHWVSGVLFRRKYAACPWRETSSPPLGSRWEVFMAEPILPDHVVGGGAQSVASLMREALCLDILARMLVVFSSIHESWQYVSILLWNIGICSQNSMWQPRRQQF
jgi:hypothetical protein